MSLGWRSSWLRARSGGVGCWNRLNASGLRGSGGGLLGLVDGWLPAAVVGGVACPVPAAGVLPGDGDLDVDAEESCEQCGGQLEGQAEQRGGAGLGGAEPELA